MYIYISTQASGSGLLANVGPPASLFSSRPECPVWDPLQASGSASWSDEGPSSSLKLRPLLGLSGGAWACLVGTTSFTATTVLPWLHWSCAVLGVVWECSPS